MQLWMISVSFSILSLFSKLLVVFFVILQLFSKTWEKKEKEYKDIVNFAAKENQNLLCWKIRHLTQ